MILLAAALCLTLDAKVEAILAANEKTLISLTSLSAECTTDSSQSGATLEKATIFLGRPFLVRYERWTDAAKQPKRTLKLLCDGKRFVREEDGAYLVFEKPKLTDGITLGEDTLQGFFSTRQSFHTNFTHPNPDQIDCTYTLAPSELVDGTLCDVIAYRYRTVGFKGNDFQMSGKLYFGPDHLIRRRIHTSQYGTNAPRTRTTTLTKIAINVPLPPRTTFSYTPAKDMKQEKLVSPTP